MSSITVLDINFDYNGANNSIFPVIITSNEVAEGIENISSGIEEQLRTMTEIESTTEQLSEMAKRLRELTSGFRV